MLLHFHWPKAESVTLGGSDKKADCILVSKTSVNWLVPEQETLAKPRLKYLLLQDWPKVSKLAPIFFNSLKTWSYVSCIVRGWGWTDPIFAFDTSGLAPLNKCQS